MADEKTPTITLTMTPQGPLDEGYAQVERDNLIQEMLRAEGFGMEGDQPSAVATGAAAAFQAAGQGAQNTMQGLAKFLLPQEGVASGEDAATFLKGKVEAVRQALVEGLGGLALSPLVGVGASARQALANQNPELEKAKALDPLQASFVRMMMGGGNPLKEGKDADINKEMSVGEALDLVIQSAPMAAGAAGKVGKAIKEQAPVLKGERGALEMTPPSERPTPGPGESRLNVERIEATDRVKSLMTEINKLVGEKVLAEHRKTVTHEATIESARKYTLQDALAADPNTVSLAEGRSLQQAVRDYHVAVGTKMSEMEAERAKTLGAKLPDEYVEMFSMQLKLAAANELFQAAHARGTEAAKILSNAERVRLTRDQPASTLAIAEALRANAEDPATLADRLAAMRAELDIVQQRSWQYQTHQGLVAGKDLLYAGWVQGMLSGWRTHAKNVGGSTLAFAFEVPEHFTAELVTLLQDDPKSRMVFGETGIALRGSFVAMRDGIRLAAKAWKMNEAPFEKEARERSTVGVYIGKGGREITEGKVGRTAMGAEAYGLENTVPGKVVDVLAKALNSRYTPGAALITEDGFFKGVAYSMQIDALAYRNSFRDAKPGATAAEINGEYQRLKTSPTKEMIIEAQDNALLLTMNEELGPFGQAAVKMLDHLWGARVTVPFVRWWSNAIKWVNQRAPILSELSAKNQADIAAGGDLGAKAIARMMVGHAAAGTLVMLALQGKITGGGLTTKDRALAPFREGPDYSIALPNGQWVERYDQWFGAPGMMMAAVVDYVNILRYIPAEQSYIDQWAAGAEGLIMATGNVFVHQGAMQGLGNIYDAIQDPQRSAGKEAQSLVRSLIPTMLRDMTRASDDNLIREVRSMGDALRSGLPYFVESIPGMQGFSVGSVAPHRHPITGEPQVYPPGVASEMDWPYGFFANMSAPIGFTKSRDAVWAKEIYDNRIVVRPVPNYINGSDPKPDEPHMTEVLPSVGVHIDPWERDFWIEQMTKVQKDGAGRNLQEALTYLMRPGSRYWNLSPGPENGRSIEIKNTIDYFKKKGYMALLDPKVGSPTLKARVFAQLEARMKAKLPVTDSRSPFAATTGR